MTTGLERRLARLESDAPAGADLVRFILPHNGRDPMPPPHRGHGWEVVVLPADDFTRWADESRAR